MNGGGTLDEFFDPTGCLKSGSRIEHRHRATILRPAGNIVADRDRALLAVGDRAHALRLDAARGEIVAHGLCAPGAERDVVFARAALVGMALDGEGILAVGSAATAPASPAWRSIAA